MPSSTIVVVSIVRALCPAIVYSRGGAGVTHGWRLEVDGALRVEDEVEQAAVGVVALELDLEGCCEVEGLGGGGKS